MNRRSAWGVVALLTLMNLFNYLDRFILPALLTKVKAELSLDHAQAGFFGSAFIIVYSLTSPVFGRLADVGSRRLIIAIGVGVWSLASASGGLAIGFFTLLLARAFVGIGEAAYATVTPSLIGDLFPRERRGRAMAIFFLAIPIGAALGYLAGGLLGERIGWRGAFIATGLPGLLFALIALRMPEPPRGVYDAAPPAPPPLRDVAPILWKNREYVWTVIGYTAQTFAVGGLSFWMPTYLQEVRGMKLEPANLLFGISTVIGGLVGTALGGVLGDVLAKRLRHPYLVVSAVSTLVCAPLAVGVFWVTDPLIMRVLLISALTCLFMSTGPINTVLVNSVPPGIRSLAQAVCIFTIHAGGDAISPFLIGAVAEVAGLADAVLLVPLTLVVGAAAWFYAARFEQETR